jgi:hypothetical protein
MLDMKPLYIVDKKRPTVIDKKMKKEIAYPAEITFKSVFHIQPDLDVILASILDEQGITGEITHRPSRNNKFVSYTITADFESEPLLEEVCKRIVAIQGFIMMF